VSVELLDAFADDGTFLGALPRDEVHRRGLWHHTWHLWIVTGRGTIVVQRRSTAKAVHPGLLDVSAAGHLAAGEVPADGLRELEEELGVTADPAALVALGIRRDAVGTDREIVHEHLLRDDRPLEAYRPDPAEVAGLLEVPIAGLPDLPGLVPRPRAAYERIAAAAAQHLGSGPWTPGPRSSSASASAPTANRTSPPPSS
jgi:isopentenyldiphosphate isomerase